MPSVPNAPTNGQAARLSMHRQASSIPTATAEQLPEHQGEAAGQAGVWMYPSEQQFFNAMRRKVPRA